MSMPRPWVAGLLASLCLFAVAAFAHDSPRTEVEGIARAIEGNYFDAARGREIADGLREAAIAGAFDGDTDPATLADALTRRLRPLDHHFRVRWSPGGAAVPIAGMGGPIPRRVPPHAGNDTGIRDVEVLPGNIGYLSLGAFVDFEFGDADAPARRAIDAALHQLSDTAAMIIDVRGNRGGSPHMVGYLVSAFVAPSDNVYNIFHSRDGTRSEAPAQAYPHPRAGVPLYVLIDGHTGSAAESFAYTLQGARRAVIVGETSGGAANPGRFIATPDGFSVFVPTGSPVNPFTHANWEDHGVKPDVPAASSAALETALALARKTAKDTARKP
ncbi:MAG TPA: S41 family peptidase [Rhodanobacteraceae bacterium]|nr:S41 family peptidase [Rhodanobacteraceae bacterium]